MGKMQGQGFETSSVENYLCRNELKTTNISLIRSLSGNQASVPTNGIEFSASRDRYKRDSVDLREVAAPVPCRVCWMP